MNKKKRGMPTLQNKGHHMKIDEIRKLCDDATPGPWRISEYKGDYHVYNSKDEPVYYSSAEEGVTAEETDAEFITAARALLPLLLDVVELLKDRPLYFRDAIDRAELLERLEALENA